MWNFIFWIIFLLTCKSSFSVMAPFPVFCVFASSGWNLLTSCLQLLCQSNASKVLSDEACKCRRANGEIRDSPCFSCHKSCLAAQNKPLVETLLLAVHSLPFITSKKLQKPKEKKKNQHNPSMNPWTNTTKNNHHYQKCFHLVMSRAYFLDVTFVFFYSQYGLSGDLFIYLLIYLILDECWWQISGWFCYMLIFTFWWL